MHSDQAKLNKAGYTTMRFTPYHFQVIVKGADRLHTVKINVWPTAKKVLKEFTAGPAPHYTDIVPAVEKILKGPTRKSLKQLAAELRAQTPVLVNHESRYLAWWKQQPMVRLQEYIENV